MSTLKSSAEDLTLNADGSGNDVIIQSDGSTKAIVTAEGNVGIGVTPEAWQSTRTALQVGDSTAVWGDAYKNTWFTNNVYRNSSNNECYINDSYASEITMTNGGITHFKVAPSGSADATISWETVMTIDNDGIITKPAQPAFSARAATTNIPLTTATTITLDSERFDVGGNLAANTFTAPVTGKYLITYMLYFTGVDADHTTLDCTIDTSNKVYQQTWKPSVTFSADANFSISGAQICDMDASDTMYIRIYVASGAAQTDIHTDSTVSGILLA